MLLTFPYLKPKLCQKLLPKDVLSRKCLDLSLIRHARYRIFQHEITHDPLARSRPLHMEEKRW